MLHNKYLFRVSLLLFIVTGCNEKKELNKKPSTLETPVKNKHAEGFSIEKNETYNVLHINNPWPKSENSYKYALIPKQNVSTLTLNKNEFNGFITTPVQKIVVTSTTHIPALELLGVEQTLVGFPGTDYVSSKKTRERIDNDFVRELGNNEGINTEVLLELRPDVVVAFGVDGTNKSMKLIEKAGIPIIYNGDWVEKSPLAKAEWIKCFGALYDKEKEAETIFNQIEADYTEAKKIASEATSKPTVLCGAMYKDVWYLPSGTSPEAQFLKDANTNYLWSNTKESGSLALSFEAVYEKAKDANLWLSPSYYKSYEDLKTSSNHYTKFDAFQKKNIFTFSNTTGQTGGVTYYELGISRPDLVLKDMIKICHPELLVEYEPTFFKPLK
ncbi:ABC transporter substrate-binding protein [Psychroserpens mesophilus]|uniref:ABC transporter substrate-binding protein n=1 Tax=Psychroserpens mesophilus TaxID=325473 RepID=UPI003D66126E